MTKRIRGQVAAMGASALLLLVGGCAHVDKVQQQDRQVANAVGSAGSDQKTCVYENPMGSRIKQKICETAQQRALRQAIAENQVFRDAWRPLDRGCVDGRRVGC